MHVPESTSDVLRKFWDLETLGIRDEKERPPTPDENRAIAQAKKTLRLADGRYEIGIPWRTDEPKLENNYDMALSRLTNLE